MKKNVSLEQLFDTVRLKKTEQSPFVVYTIPNSKKVNFKSGPCFNENYSNRETPKFEKDPNVGFGRNLFSLLRKNAISAESGAGLNLIND